jgi:hypothetical protein
MGALLKYNYLDVMIMDTLNLTAAFEKHAVIVENFGRRTAYEGTPEPIQYMQRGASEWLQSSRK